MHDPLKHTNTHTPFTSVIYLVIQKLNKIIIKTLMYTLTSKCITSIMAGSGFVLHATCRGVSPCLSHAFTLASWSSKYCMARHEQITWQMCSMQDTRTYLDNDGVCSKVKWSCIVSIGEVRSTCSLKNTYVLIRNFYFAYCCNYEKG